MYYWAYTPHDNDRSLGYAPHFHTVRRFMCMWGIILASFEMVSSPELRFGGNFIITVLQEIT